MRLRDWLIAVMITWMVTSCVSVPNVAYCIQDPQRGKLHCAETQTSREYEVKYPESDHYICMHPDDYQKILNYISDVTRKAGLQKDLLYQVDDDL